MSPTHLVLLRHGQTEWNHAGRMQGHADVHLDEVGRAQALAVGQALADRGFATIVSSDLARAHDTAMAVSDVVGVPVVIDERLREINVGSWAGLTRAQIEEEYPDFAAHYAAGRDFRRSEEGETVAEMVARALPAIEEVIAAHQGQRVLVVAHGFLLARLLETMLGVSGPRRVIGGLANAHWSEVAIEGAMAWLVAHNVGAQH